MLNNDNTYKIESDVKKEHKPQIKYLFKLFIYVFKSTKAICLIYMGLFILLSLLRPIMAFIWKKFIETAELPYSQCVIISSLCLLLVYFVINFLANLICRYVYLYDDIEQINIVQANRQQEKLNAKLYENFAAIDPEYFEVPQINDKIEQTFNFISARYGGMNTAIMLQCYCIIAKSVSITSIAISLFFFHPLLCLIVLLAPLPTIWVETIGQNLKFQFLKDNTKILRKANYFQNLMLSSAVKEMKTLNLHSFIYNKWKGYADQYLQKEIELIKNKSKFVITHNLIINFTIVLGNVLAIILMTLGKLTIGTLGAVFSLVSTLVSDTRELLSGIATLTAKKNEATQFFDLMELSKQNSGNKQLSDINIIEADNLKYRYPLTDEYVLNGIDLKIKKGEKIAFVGENGAGKTTLVKLIEGVICPSNGKLTFNGIEVSELDIANKNAKISTVPQNSLKYETFTVGDNIYIGKTDEKRDETAIDLSLNFVGLETVDKETLIGQSVGGIDLSGGQWQKIAIARSAYRSKNFIILDEPTSNIDPITESAIFKKYMEMAKDKTVIFVTHRISAASLANRIVVLKNGKIVQDGRHDDLIKIDGEYLRLYNEQAKWYNR